jgi:hypothetical protein
MRGFGCSEPGVGRTGEQGYHGRPPASRGRRRRVPGSKRASGGACMNTVEGGQSHAGVHCARAKKSGLGRAGQTSAPECHTLLRDDGQTSRGREDSFPGGPPRRGRRIRKTVSLDRAVLE